MTARFWAVAAGSVLLLAGCTTTPAAAPTSAAGARAEQSATGTVIDVRTPDEFSAGHLDGAVNIDLSAADFADRIAALDPAAAYTVYCRTGNRSATAVAQMSAQGFTDVTDGGSIDEAADLTGLPVVTD